MNQLDSILSEKELHMEMKVGILIENLFIDKKKNSSHHSKTDTFLSSFRI